jgi:hypothetical protein
MSRYRQRIEEDEELFREAQRLSTANIHGLEITDDDLPTFTPMFKTGDEVATVNGNIGRFLKYGEKNAPGTEPSCDVEIDGVSTHFKSQSSLVLLADKLKAQEERKKKDEKAAERAAARAAREDAAALSDNFYAMQFFNLIDQINTAPKEFTPAEFAQSVLEQLTVAYQALSAADAKRIKPAPKMFPTIAQGDENKLFMFLSADAVGRKSPINAVFGGIDGGSLRSKEEKFAQRICDKFYYGKYKVTVTDITPPPTTKAAARPPLTPDEPLTTKVGDKSEPTPNGYYYDFVKTGGSRPYAVKQVGKETVLNACKNKADAELKVACHERNAAAEKAKAGEGA